jgi:hypothetical protein
MQPMPQNAEETNPQKKKEQDRALIIYAIYIPLLYHEVTRHFLPSS